jgi:hypothetical protein
MTTDRAIAPREISRFDSPSSGHPLARPLFALACALCIGAFAGTSTASADIYVIQSNAPDVRVGVRLMDGDTVTIPAGATVRVVLPSGKTQTVHGAYSAKVSELTKGVQPNEGLMARVAKILETGGATETTTGATRGIGNANKLERMLRQLRGFSLVEVPSYVNGKFCLLKGGNVRLTRLSTKVSDQATLIDATSFERALVAWDAGSSATAWPAGLQLRPDATYQVLIQGKEIRDIAVRIFDKEPGEDDMLIELDKAGCVHQLEAWVGDQVSASKGKP